MNKRIIEKQKTKSRILNNIGFGGVKMEKMEYGITEYPDVEQLYKRLNALISQPIHPVRRERMQVRRVQLEPGERADPPDHVAGAAAASALRAAISGSISSRVSGGRVVPRSGAVIRFPFNSPAITENSIFGCFFLVIAPYCDVPSSSSPCWDVSPWSSHLMPRTDLCSRSGSESAAGARETRPDKLTSTAETPGSCHRPKPTSRRCHCERSEAIS